MRRHPGEEKIPGRQPCPELAVVFEEVRLLGMRKEGGNGLGGVVEQRQ